MSALLITCALGAALIASACAAPAAPPASKPAAGAANAAAAASPAAAAPSAGPAATATPPPRAAFSIGHLPPAAFQWSSYVALDKGYFVDQGLDLEVIQIGAPNEAARAAVSGSVSLAHFSVDAAVRAIESGGNLVVVGSEISNPAFSLIVQPEVQDYAGLRGKLLAVSAPRDGAAVILRSMLRARGLGDDDYDFLSVGTTPNRYAALKSRQAEGAIMTQPLDFVALDEGYRLLERSTTVIQDFMFMSVSANRAWAEANRPVAVRYLRALGAAIDWLYNPANRDEAIEVLRARTNTDRAAVERTYALFIEEGKVIPRHAAVPVAGLNVMLQAMIELGDLPGPTADPARYMDNSYVQAASQ